MKSVNDLVDKVMSLKSIDQLQIVEKILEHMDYQEVSNNVFVIKDTDATYHSHNQDKEMPAYSNSLKKRYESRQKSMLSYKQKFINDILKLPDEKAKKLYLIFNLIVKEFVRESKIDQNWKDDFKKISVWKNDDFDDIQNGFKRWNIEKF